MVATAKTTPKPFDIILVHKFDRFARSREDGVVYKSLLKKECGVRVLSITESIEDDKFSVILEAMLEAMAEYYSLNLADEVKKGMTEKAERGEFQAKPPLGYMMENKKLVKLMDEAKIVNLIFHNFASRKMNLTQLSHHLNGLNIKTRSGNAFGTRAIDYILNNPVYIGKTRWTPVKKSRNTFNHPESIIRDGDHEPIIDIETWDKTQERVRENKEIYRKRERPTAQLKTWLKGLIRCSACGYMLVVNGKNYMQCNGFLKGQCKQSSHTTIDKLETAVLEELRKTYTGELEINVVPSANDTGSASEFEVLQDRLEKIGDKEVRIKTAYEDGIDTLDEYGENKKRLSAERESLKNALVLLKEKILENRHDGEIIKRIAGVYEFLIDDTVDMEQKYQTAHLIINEITYSKPEKALTLVYK